MKRLISPVQDGGIPYINSDFNEILQKEHIKSYSAHLDAINDIPFGSSNNNRGIIVKGCKINNGNISNVNFDFTNSMIYLPGLTSSGDFYEPAPAIAIQNFSFNHDGIIYLVAAPDINESRTFRDGVNKVATTTKYFTIQKTAPGVNDIYIQFDFSNVLNRIITRRSYKRLLKYFTFNTDDVFNTGNLNDFNTTTGEGLGDMYGFHLCNGSNNTYNLSGRFIIGYDSSAPSTPVDNTTIYLPQFNSQTYNSTDVINYGAIGNFGGGRKTSPTSTLYLPSKVLIIPELPSHNHSGQVTGNGQHTHTILAGNNFSNGSYLRNGGPGVGGQLSVDDGGSGGSHTHGLVIDTTGNNNAHEIRSPYIVLAYYQKISI